MTRRLDDQEHDLASAEAMLFEQQARLHVLNVISSGIIAGETLDEVIEDAMRAVAEHMPGLRVSFGTVSEEGALIVRSSCGPAEMPAVDDFAVDLSAAPRLLEGLKARHILISRDTQADTRLEEVRDLLETLGTRAALAVPVSFPGKLLGLLELDSSVPRRWTAHELGTITQVAEHLSLAAAEADAREEKRKADESRRESEELYRVLVETSPDAILLTTPDGRIVFGNPQAARLCGFDTTDAFADRRFLDLIVPEDRERAAEDARRTLDLGSVRAVEYTLRRGESVCPVEISASLVADADRRPRGLLVVIRDVAARRRGEQEQAQLQGVIRKSALEWRRTFDAIESPVLILEFGGRIVRVNRSAAELAGRGFREIVGHPVGRLGSGQPWRAAGRLAARVGRTRAGCSLRVQEAERTWDLSASLMSTEGLGDERAIIVARDVTETVELEASLRRSEKMSAMGALMAGVAHEVRNPLFSISATLDAFEARFGRREEFARHIAILRGELERLIGLMRDLLTYGKPAEPALRAGALSAVIDDASRSCAPFAERLGVKIIVEHGDRLPLVPMESDRMAEVFQNLIENAIQHSPRDGVVHVSTTQRTEDEHRWIDCSVADSGPGFEEQDLPLVFEPFFTKRRGGTGLGLSIVQRIVEQHGGSVTAHNRAEGGALIIVRIPL